MGLEFTPSESASRAREMPESNQSSMLRDAMGDPPKRDESEYVEADEVMFRRDRSMSLLMLLPGES